jgi:hypothetical protein
MALKMILLAALLLAPLEAAIAVAVACADDGSLAVHRVTQHGNTFSLHRQRDASAPMPIGPAVTGVFSEYSPMYATAAQDSAVVASFRRPPVLTGIVWLADGRSVVLNGRVVHSVLPSGGDIAALVRVMPAGSLDKAADVVIDRDGRVVAERTLAWHDELGYFPTLDVGQTLMFDRPVPGVAIAGPVELRDLRTLDVVTSFSFGERIIEDVVVVSRRLLFFVSSGGVFKLEDGVIESIGGMDPQMRYVSLDIDPQRERLLVKAYGGYRVFAYDGTELSADILGRPLHVAKGFTDDGHVLEDEVYRQHGLRLRDPLTADVVSELVGKRPPIARGHRMACAFADKLVTVDREGVIREEALMPHEGG